MVGGRPVGRCRSRPGRPSDRAITALWRGCSVKSGIVPVCRSSWPIPVLIFRFCEVSWEWRIEGLAPESVMAREVADGIADDEPRHMHIISRRKLREFSRDHPDAGEALDRWYNAARKAIWRNFSDLRATFGSADQVGNLVVFNIGGNKYRLIVRIYYKDAVILIRHILTHKQYDLGDWKSEPEP
jgi:mRNA interferase HigB